MQMEIKKNPDNEQEEDRREIIDNGNMEVVYGKVEIYLRQSNTEVDVRKPQNKARGKR